ncbi:MAG: hypothetical protein EAZ08_08260 [Cytophagales bacterium]|nr:MAG: hypothetical protein EAZ08_08260 [Cytophagales bacterium]
MIILTINIKRVIFILCSVFAILFVMNWATVMQSMSSDTELTGAVMYFYKAFNFQEEKNIPTYFSVILLFLSSQTFLIIRLLDKFQVSSYVKHYWTQMSLIFLLLSIDEMVRLHERLGYVARYLYFVRVDSAGLFKFGWVVWVVPMSMLLVIFGLYSIKFLMRIPNHLRIGYIVSGGLYVLGAIGFETISAQFSTLNEAEQLYYYLSMTAEESLEMIGIITLLYFNFGYINELSIGDADANGSKP